MRIYHVIVQVETLRSGEAANRLVYDPVADKSVFERGNRQIVGTTVRWIFERNPVNENKIPPSTAGLEEQPVRFFDGLTNAATGALSNQAGLEKLINNKLIEPGARRAVTNLPSASNLGIARVFVDARLPFRNFPGVEMVLLPADPVQARTFLSTAGLKVGDLILLNVDNVVAGSEQEWKPAGSATPIIAISAVGLEEATPPELAALARIARNLSSQVLRVGLEEWNKRAISDQRLSIQY